VLPLSESISHLAIALIEQHALRDGLQVADSLIAATARESGETLGTGNMKHFRRISNLDLKAFRP
jgi:predicted nucleic acid-binding protein